MRRRAPARRSSSFTSSPATIAAGSRSRANAAFIQREGMAKFAATYGHGPTRVQFQNKDPRGFAEYIGQLTEHSALGSANTMLGYQSRRPSLYDLTDEMARIEVPTLIMAGAEEEPCLEGCLLM